MKNDKKEISQIGLGLSQLNNNLYNEKKFTVKNINSLIKYAIKKGIKYFDTAHNYGETEKILGKLNKDLKKKIHIFTKAGFESNGIRDFSQPYLKKKNKSFIKKFENRKFGYFFFEQTVL